MNRNTSGSMGFDMSSTTLGTEMRKRRGDTSLRAVSRACGISPATLSRIEADLIDLPSRDTLVAISHAYGIPLEHLAQLVYCGGRPSQAIGSPALATA